MYSFLQYSILETFVLFLIILQVLLGHLYSFQALSIISVHNLWGLKLFIKQWDQVTFCTIYYIQFKAANQKKRWFYKLWAILITHLLLGTMLYCSL